MKIRDIIKAVEADGWKLHATRGSHRHYRHATKPGKVTIAGHPSKDLSAGMLRSILKQAGIERKDLE